MILGKGINLLEMLGFVIYTRIVGHLASELEIKTSEGVKEVVLNTDGVIVKEELVKDED